MKKDSDISGNPGDGNKGAAKVDHEASRFGHSDRSEQTEWDPAEGLDGTEAHELRRAEREAKRRSKALGAPASGRSRWHRDGRRHPFEER